MAACVIFNPAARGEKAGALARWLAAHAQGRVLKPTTGPGDAERLACEAIAEGFDRIIAAGGDGTMNEVARGMMAAPGGMEGASLGVLPMGTVNVYAMELGLPADLESCWRIAISGRERKVDLIEVVEPSASVCSTRLILQLAGAGVDARAVELASYRLKKRIGRWAYAWSAIRALGERRGCLRVEWDGGETFEAEQLFIGKGSRYGGRMKLFPEARLDDGKIHLFAMKRVSMAALAGLARTLWAPGRGAGKAGTRFLASWVRLSAAGRVPFQVDGDAAGCLPCAMRVMPGALRVMVA